MEATYPIGQFWMSCDASAPSAATKIACSCSLRTIFTNVTILLSYRRYCPRWWTGSESHRTKQAHARPRRFTDSAFRWKPRSTWQSYATDAPQARRRCLKVSDIPSGHKLRCQKEEGNQHTLLR